MPSQVAEGGRKVNYISKELYAKVASIQTFHNREKQTKKAEKQ